MVRINKHNYLEKRTPHKHKGKYIYRDWWFIGTTSNERNNIGVIQINNITIPERLLGKRIKIKIEVMED